MVLLPRSAAGLPVYLALCLAVPALAAESPADWVRQLGSRRFAEREAAEKAIDAIGEPALPFLATATQSTDPEVRRRADTLHQRIQRRVENARLTAPRQVQLAYRKLPVADAIADFNQKTGFILQTEGDPKLLKDRTVSLDTGKVTLWQALDQFTRAADLTEWRLLSESERASRKPPVQSPKKVHAQSSVEYILDHIGTAGPYVLVPGKPAALPTYETGGVRVRALPPGTPGWGQSAGTGDISCLLEVTPQPGMMWVATQDVKVLRAVDDQGQQLKLVPPEPVVVSPSAVVRWRIAAIRRRSIYLYGALPTVRPHLTPIRLGPGAKPSRQLKEIEGVVLGRMLAPPETILTVDRILKASGETIRRGSTSLRVTNVKSSKEHVVLDVELTHTPNGEEFRGPLDDYAGSRFNPEDVRLEDSTGADYELVQGMTTGEQVNGPTVTTSLTMLYRARPRQGEAAKLVLRSRRPTIVELPFRLENVPVP